MAVTIEFKDKYVYFSGASGLHTQGEAYAETYDITGPRYYDGRDLSILTWYVRAGHPDYHTLIDKQISASVAPENEEKVILTWALDADFLAYPGPLALEFVGKTESGAEIIKLQSNGLTIKASVSGTVSPPKNTFEKILSKMEQLADDTIDAAAQSKVDAERAEKAQATAVNSAAKALASEQSSTASKQAAENAAKEAKDAAQEAVGFRTFQGGAVLPIDGDADLTQPLPTKTAASISVTSGENRISSITVNGFTTQAGSGDPSPSNVHPISNAGTFNAVAVFDGSSNELWSLQGTYANTVRFDLPSALLNNVFSATEVVALCNLFPVGTSPADSDDYEHIRTSSSEGTKDTLVVFVAKSRLGDLTADGFKEFLKQANMYVAYQSTEDTGKHYTGIEVKQGDEYHCEVIELQAPLHEGDTLETNVQSEFDKSFLVDDSQNPSAVNELSLVYRISFNSLLRDLKQQDKQLSSSFRYAFEYEVDDEHFYIHQPSGNLYVFISKAKLSAGTQEAAKQYFKSNPLRIFYKSTSGGAPFNAKREEHTKKTYVFTGEEAITSGTSQSKTYFSLQGVNVKAPSAMGEVGSVKCNMLAPVAQNDVIKGDYRICISTGGNFLFHFTDDVTTVEHAKQILAEKFAAKTPFVIEYELKALAVFADVPVEIENPKGGYTLSGEDGTTLQSFVRTTPMPNEIGAAEIAKNISALTKNTAIYGNGMVVEWGSLEVKDLACTTPSGGLYTGRTTSIAFSSAFSSPPLVFSTFITNENYAFACPVGVSTEGITGIELARGTSATISGSIVFLAIGTKI